MDPKQHGETNGGSDVRFSEAGMRETPQQGGGEPQSEQRSHETSKRMGETVQQTREQVRQQAGEAAEQFRQQSRDFMSQQKDRLVHQMEHLGAAVRVAGERLQHEGDSNVAHYVSGLAQQIDKTSDYLRRRDVNGMMDDVGALARQRPEIFLGAMFLGGLACARFLSASRKHSPTHSGSSLYAEYIEPESQQQQSSSSADFRHTESSSSSETATDVTGTTAPNPASSAEHAADSEIGGRDMQQPE